MRLKLMGNHASSVQTSPLLGLRNCNVSTSIAQGRGFCAGGQSYRIKELAPCH